MGYIQIKRTDRITDKFSKNISSGYPMSSFLVYPRTKKPVVDPTDKERIFVEQKTFAEFIKNFKKWLFALHTS